MTHFNVWNTEEISNYLASFAVSNNGETDNLLATHLQTALLKPLGKDKEHLHQLTSLPDDLVVEGYITLPDHSLARTIEEAREWFTENFPEDNMQVPKSPNNGKPTFGNIQP